MLKSSYSKFFGYGFFCSEKRVGKIHHRGGFILSIQATYFKQLLLE